MPIHDWTRVSAGIFHDFHHEWISTIHRALNAGLLPPDYYALAELAGEPGPDVVTVVNVRFTAVAEPEQYARKRNRVVVRHSSDDRVIAMIELVSPGNKGSRHALRAFVEKALELLEAGIHLLIVDLFPPGPRDPQGIHAAIWSEISDDNFELPADKRHRAGGGGRRAPRDAVVPRGGPVRSRAAGSNLSSRLRRRPAALARRARTAFGVVSQSTTRKTQNAVKFDHFWPADDGAETEASCLNGYIWLSNVSYSSCGPIQNQTMVLSSRTPTAR